MNHFRDGSSEVTRSNFQWDWKCEMTVEFRCGRFPPWSLAVLGMARGQGWRRHSGHAEFSRRMSRLWVAVLGGFVGSFLLAGVVVERAPEPTSSESRWFHLQGGHRCGGAAVASILTDNLAQVTASPCLWTNSRRRCWDSSGWPCCHRFLVLA